MNQSMVPFCNASARWAEQVISIVPKATTSCMTRLKDTNRLKDGHSETTFTQHMYILMTTHYNF